VWTRVLIGLLGLSVGFVLTVLLVTATMWLRALPAHNRRARALLDAEEKRHQEAVAALARVRDDERVAAALRLAEVQRQRRYQELRATLIESTVSARRTIPGFIYQIGSEVTASTYSAARNRASRAMQTWVNTVCPVLREGGHLDLAERFEHVEVKAPPGTQAALREAYQKRLALLTPWPPFPRPGGEG
jgi:phage terminase Nu1 subunit (DNA packaging protein)